MSRQQVRNIKILKKKNINIMKKKNASQVSFLILKLNTSCVNTQKLFFIY